jgi:ethanolamine permease
LLGSTHVSRKTPAAALVVNMIVGILALLSGKTAEIITISVLGAVTLYVVSMLAFFRLRQTHPDLPRPFRTPGYPIVPAVALVLAACALAALSYATPWLALVYAALLAVAFLYYFLGIPKTVREAALPPLASTPVERKSET